MNFRGVSFPLYGGNKGNMMKDRIKEIRHYFSLSQSQFAKMLNKSSGFISTVETGRSGMSDDTVDNICSLFGIDKNWLLTGEGEMFSPGNEKSIANKEEAGSRVRKVRKDNNLTQEQFGAKIGYSMVMVHLVEAGKATATNDFLSRISSVFGISYNWLLTGEGEEKSDEAVVDDKLIEWLSRNPDVVRRLRIEGNLD